MERGISILALTGYRPRVIESLVVQFVIRVAHSPTGDNEGGFETAVLVGQASCLSFLNRQARCLSHHFGPKYVTEFAKRSALARTFYPQHKRIALPAFSQTRSEAGVYHGSSESAFLAVSNRYELVMRMSRGIP